MNLLTVYFKRIFLSRWYILSLAGTAMMSYIGARKYFADGNIYGLAYITELLINLDMYKKIIVFFSSMSCATIFCNDYKSKYISFVLSRTTTNRYIMYNIVLCVIAGFTSVFAGIMLFLTAISRRFPTIPIENAGPYKNICASNPHLYIILIVSIFSLYSAMWTTCGIALTSVIPDKCIALGSPVILGYLLEEITYRFPSKLNLYRLSHPGINIFGGTAISNYLYTILFFLLCILGLGCIFSYFVRRRLRNEMV